MGSAIASLKWRFKETGEKNLPELNCIVQLRNHACDVVHPGTSDKDSSRAQRYQQQNELAGWSAEYCLLEILGISNLQSHQVSL